VVALGGDRTVSADGESGATIVCRCTRSIIRSKSKTATAKLTCGERTGFGDDGPPVADFLARFFLGVSGLPLEADDSVRYRDSQLNESHLR
jgi:hypothetical protein